MATQETIKQMFSGGTLRDVEDATARQAIAQLQSVLDTMTDEDTTTAIETFQEVIDFLSGVTDDETLIGKLNELRSLINAKYTKPSGGIPKTDLSSAVQDALDNAGSGSVTSVKMNNGTPIEPDSNGVVDLGTVITSHQDISGKANKSEMSVGTESNGKKNVTLKQGTSVDVVTTVKTINNESILGSGNITIPAGQDGADGNDGIVDGVDDVVVYNNFNTAPEQGDDINVTGATIGYQMHGDIEDLQDRVDDLEEAGGIIDAWVDNDTLHIVTDDTIAYIRANRSVVNFGDTEIGSSGKTVRLTITGKNLTNNMGVAVSGTGFSVDKQSITVQAGKFHAFLDVAFAPASGTADNTTISGSIVLTSGNKSATITLSGVAKTEVVGVLTITPSTLELSAESGETAQGTLSVEGENLTPNTQLTITAPSGFTASGTLTTDQNGNVSGTITVSYTASAVASGNLTVSDGTNTATATLSGTVAQRLAAGSYFETTEQPKLRFTVLTDTSKVSVKQVGSTPAATSSYTGDTMKDTDGKLVIPATISDSGLTVYDSGGNFTTASGLTYNVTEIAENAFYNNKNLIEVTIPEGVTTIGARAFQQRSGTNLTKITLPSTLTTFLPSVSDNLYYTFYKFTKLTEFVLPDGITALPNTLANIGTDPSLLLEKVVIGSGVTSIHSGAITTGDMTGKVVVCKATGVPDVTSGSLNANLIKATLYVPDASVSAYQGNSKWNVFADIKSINDLTE